MTKPATLTTFTKLRLAAETGAAPAEIDLMRACICHHEWYGDFEITNEDLDLFAANFNRGVRARGQDGEDNTLPINLAHNQDGEAAGWIYEMTHNGDGVLRAKVEWTTLGKDKIENKLYKAISPEWYFEGYRDPETGITMSHVIVGAGLTNIPLFKKLKPLTASEGNIIIFSNKAMELKTLLSKPVTELTTEEKAFIKANKEQLTAEQKESHKEVIEEPAAEPAAPETTEEPTEPAAPAEPATPAEPTEPAEPVTPTEPATPAQGSEGMVSINANELAGLREAAGKLKAAEVKEHVNKMVASEANKDGRILPASTETLTALYMTASEEQKKLIDAFVASLPKVDLFTTRGADSNPIQGNPQEQVVKLANEKRAKDKELTFEKAVSMVLEENKELAAAYHGRGANNGKE